MTVKTRTIELKKQIEATIKKLKIQICEEQSVIVNSHNLAKNIYKLEVLNTLINEKSKSLGIEYLVSEVAKARKIESSVRLHKHHSNYSISQVLQSEGVMELHDYFLIKSN